MIDRSKIIAICGPTASGKTSLSIALAKEIDGEIISCDSMQIYRKMDIGTAKPTVKEMAGVKHHLIDIRDPGESFNVSDYKEEAERAIEDIQSRGKRAIFCGGTGLYLDAVLTANVFSSGASDEEYRASLEKIDNAELHRLLRECDPMSAEAIHQNNKKRVIRALEIFHATGITKTEWDKRSREEGSVESKVFMLDWPREMLYARIDRRVDIMLEEGLVEEARSLRSTYGKTAAQAIGYKELDPYFDGLISLDEASENIKRATRNYAKRQLTWFSHRPYVQTLSLSDEMELSDPEKRKNIVNFMLKS